MKKSILAVAGLAAVAGAIAPVAGVFAAGETSVTDNLTLTVTQACTYSTVSPASAGTADGNSYTGTGAAGNLVTLTSSKTDSGTTTSTPTTVTVSCNAQNGYTITPTFTGLSSTDTGASAQSISYNGSSKVAAAGSQTWTAYYQKNSEPVAAFTGSGTAVTGAASATTDTYLFSYKAGLAANQAAGTYTGTATYTLAPVSGS